MGANQISPESAMYMFTLQAKKIENWNVSASVKKQKLHWKNRWNIKVFFIGSVQKSEHCGNKHYSRCIPGDYPQLGQRQVFSTPFRINWQLALLLNLVGSMTFLKQMIFKIQSNCSSFKDLWIIKSSWWGELIAAQDHGLRPENSLSTNMFTSPAARLRDCTGSQIFNYVTNEKDRFK